MVISQRDSIEFVVNEIAFVRLKEKQKHVEFLFNVRITATGACEGELNWVKVNGDEKLRMRAKEYITSLGKPEIEQFIPVEDLSCRQVNEWSLDDFLFDLEKESSANITVIDDSTVRIAGSQLSVGLAKSYLEGVLPSTSPNCQMSDEISELPVKRARLDSASTIGENDSAIGEEDFSESFDEVEGLLGSLEQGEDKFASKSVSTMSLASNCEMTGVVDAVTSLPETSEEFAAKLGYSKSMYALAVKKVGKGADMNELLNELVKLKNSAKELNNDERYNEKKVDRRRSSCSIVNPKQLRPIIIDGSNVAMSHGKQKIFSCKGIALAVDWFKRRGHTTIYVMIPKWRKETPSELCPMSDQEILKSLDEAGHIVYTPSRTVNGKRIVCYDDRYIMKVAQEKDGVIVSNDNFRDLQRENLEWKKMAEERLLMYSFVDDMFMPPDDPNGRHGPTIDELLTVGSGTKTKLCQHGRKCTYGVRCKYAHPERDPTGGASETVLRDTPSNSPRPYSEPVPISDQLCEDFKRVLSLPNLHTNQSQSVGVYPMHSNWMPPTVPSRHPTQLHGAPPPLPPRNNNVPRGIRTTNENPYAPLPMPMDQAQMMLQCRRLPPRVPPQHPDYDTLPFIPRNRMQQPTGRGHYNQYNVQFIGNRRGIRNPYDNIPPPGGQMPVYPTPNQAMFKHTYYTSRAPPVDESDEEDKPSLPSKKRQHSDEPRMGAMEINGLLTRSNHNVEENCREPGMETVMHPVLNVA